MGTSRADTPALGGPREPTPGHEDDRPVDRRHRGADALAAQAAGRVRPHRLRRRRGDRHRHLRPDRGGGRRPPPDRRWRSRSSSPGIVCALAALCYAEFASTVPVAGSAYTFSYASLGELVAWIIGWDLILELALGASTVASGWSDYFADVMKSAGWTVPASLHGDGHNLIAAADRAHPDRGDLPRHQGVGAGQRRGRRGEGRRSCCSSSSPASSTSSPRTTTRSSRRPARRRPRAPSRRRRCCRTSASSPGPFGIGGVVSAAALVFFAYIGFDVVATSAEETKKPKRDLPIGIIASLAICTTLYVLVSIVVTGMVKFNQISVEGAAGRGLPVGRPARLRHADLGGRADRSDHGDDDPDDGAEPRLLRDEPRPAAAAGVQHGVARASACRSGCRSPPASPSPRSPSSSR